MPDNDSARKPIRDLSDFIIRWSDLRPLALYVRDRRRTSEEERRVIGWLIELADRVGPLDLQPREASPVSDDDDAQRLSACIVRSAARRAERCC